MFGTNVSDGIITKNGKGMHIGNVNEYQIILHITCMPKKKAIVDVLFKQKKYPQTIIGFMPFNEIQETLFERKGLKTIGDKLTLKEDECRKINVLGWRYLINTYQITPADIS